MQGGHGPHLPPLLRPQHSSSKEAQPLSQVLRPGAIVKLALMIKQKILWVSFIFIHSECFRMIKYDQNCQLSAKEPKQPTSTTSLWLKDRSEFGTLVITLQEKDIMRKKSRTWLRPGKCLCSFGDDNTFCQMFSVNNVRLLYCVTKRRQCSFFQFSVWKWKDHLVLIPFFPYHKVKIACKSYIS